MPASSTSVDSQATRNEGLAADNICDPIDFEHLRRYTLGDEGLEWEVLALFLTQAKIYLLRLREARNEKIWRETAHTIKGSARAIGAWHVAEVAAAAEKLKDAVIGPDRDKIVDVLEKRIAEVNTVIRARMKGKKPAD